MARPPKYRIHPAIGVARLGDAGSFFIGPEHPGFPPVPDKPGTAVPPYRDGGKIKPQAARFRIFEYVDKGSGYEPGREIDLTQKDVNFISWSVHLANRKASFFNFDGQAGFDRATSGRRNSVDNATRIKHTGDRKKLEIDPGVRSIMGKSKGPVEFSSKKPAAESWPDPKPVPEITTLGRLYTDAAGRLLVLGGLGVTGRRPGAGSRDINNYANNDGWFDDISDGPVTATLSIGGKTIPVEPAWVLCAPPDFAPATKAVVTLYDVLYDIAARSLTLPTDETTYKTGALKRLGLLNADFKANKGTKLSSFKPDFETEIYPILAAAVGMRFVYGPAAHIHTTIWQNWAILASADAANESMRTMILNFLRVPVGAVAAPGGAKGTMPRLLGDEPYKRGGSFDARARATVTITQYEVLKQWAAGNFVPSKGAPAAPKSAPAITPEGLDRAALENCVGAAMYPGIEVSWQIRYPKIYKAPFRIDQAAGSPYLGDKPATIRPGHFSRQMALPWQADFLMCRKEHTTAAPYISDWGWWPSQRPDTAYQTAKDVTDGKDPVLWNRAKKDDPSANWPAGGAQPNYAEMVKYWSATFGFLVDQGGMVLETERGPDVT